MSDESAAQPSPDNEHLWEVGFDGHQRAQQARMAKWTLKQKIEWLEQAHYMVLHLQAQRQLKAEQAACDTIAEDSDLGA